MTHFEFINVLLNNVIYYFISLLICSVLFYQFGRKFTNSWFDPLRFQLITSTFSCAVVLFLSFSKIIDFAISFYFITSLLAFWISFRLFSRKQIEFSNKLIINEDSIANTLFIIFTSLYLFFTLISYRVLGIPLFGESRLDSYSGSGLGFIYRIQPFLLTYSTIYIYYSWDSLTVSKSKKINLTIILCLFLITGILSGSRSIFLHYIFCYWGYRYFYKQNIDKLKIPIKVIVFAGIVSVFSFSLKLENSTLIASIGELLIRAVASGDCYYMALPNNVIDSVDIGVWYRHLFYNFLGPVRLISGQEIPPPVGFQLTWIVNPTLYGISAGPLSTPQLLGYLYFKNWGIIFSIVVGGFLSFILFRFNKLIPNGIIGSIVSTYIYIQLMALIGDVCLGMGVLFDICFSLTFFLFIIIFIKLIQLLKLKYGPQKQD